MEQIKRIYFSYASNRPELKRLLLSSKDGYVSEMNLSNESFVHF